MAEPIRNARVNNLAEAPTPQNTPATQSSFIQRASDGRPSVSTILEDDGAALLKNMALLSMIEGKLGNIVADIPATPAQRVASLPVSVRNRVHGLKALQAEHAKVEQELEDQVLALEKKYHKLYQPLYLKRAQIVNGDAEPTKDEIEEGKTIEQEEQGDDADKVEKPKLEEIFEEGDVDNKTDVQDKSDIPKGIPDFWATALKNIPIITDGITEKDEEALHYLTDVYMEYLNEPGFTLFFDFAENPFFSNKQLTKTYYYTLIKNDGYTINRSTGTEIDWKSPEKNLTVKIERRKQRNKHTKATRTIEKTVPEFSFFSFFSPPPINKDLIKDGLISGEASGDNLLGQAIKEAIPRAIDWYTGIALEYDDDDEYVDEDDFELESEDELDGDDDDEDDEYEEKALKKEDATEPADCKQQ